MFVTDSNILKTSTYRKDYYSSNFGVINFVLFFSFIDMEIDNFISKLKANDSEKDLCDLGKSYDEYVEILKKLTPKDKSSFSFNVLCILYRNLIKVPSWRDKINNKELLVLSVECVRHTRALNNPEQVKTLASIFHIHRHVITQNSNAPPKLVLKLSYMPFECENLLKEYYKTYGHIIIDRIVYIEKLKLERVSIIKLIPKLIEDIIKIINVYDTVQFCTVMLTFLVKKLYYIYNDSPEDINVAISKLFESLSTKELNKIEKLSEKEALDLYITLNECLYAVAESTKTNFNSVWDSAIQVSISLLGHRPDMFHCFQSIWNPFCSIFNEKTTTKQTQNLLNGLLHSCTIAEKLEYKTTLHITYPYISQLLRSYIEVNVNSKNVGNLNETIQEYCFKLVLHLLDKLRNTKQLTRCEKCNAKSGMHDVLRLTFSINCMLTNQENSTNNIQLYYTIVEKQYAILDELRLLKCPNTERFFRKLQIDVHNVAVVLNKQKQYEFSLKLFTIYINNELKNIKNDTELKNVSRALYNRSICEQDFKLYKQSLQSAYLSLIFSLPEGLNTEKYMHLVIDIKSKALKSETDDNINENNDLQGLSILDVCMSMYDDKCYTDFRMFIKNLKFSSLLMHDFSMYVKLWPSVLPIPGVWKALYSLVMMKNGWIQAEDKEMLLMMLYQVVLETPTAVKTIHHDTFKTIVGDLVKRCQEYPPSSVRNKIIYAALLLLKSEYDIADAIQEYGWKVDELTMDPDMDSTVQTLKQEYDAVGSAIKAVEVLTDAVQELESGVLPNTMLTHITQIMCVSVQELLHFEIITEALQLAYLGCLISDVAGDKLSYIRHASVLIGSGERHKELQCIVARGAECAAGLMNSEHSMDAALCFVCDVAIYNIKSRCLSVASRLIRMVQTKVLEARNTDRKVDLELSVGRLMHAQALLSPGSGQSILSQATGLHRQYLAVGSSGSSWTLRRHLFLYIKQATAVHGGRSVRVARGLLLQRRCRAAAATALPPAGAAARARVYALVANTHAGNGQTEVTSTLKYILGQKKSRDTIETPSTDCKIEQFIPKRNNVETMLDSMVRTVPTSPSLPQSVPVFQTLDFLKHAKTCTCYACSIPACAIIACQICYLDAATYYRAKEFDIARNYFDGALKTFDLANAKLKEIFDKYSKKYNNIAIDIAKKLVYDEFKTVQLEFLVELVYFELTQNEFEKSDDHIVGINEMLSDFANVDPYLRNEILNMMIVSATLRKTKVAIETGLENDMEELKISPNAIMKTPETKRVPYVESVKVVTQEEIPQRKLERLKFNIDNAGDEIVDKKVKSKFKVPEPVICKPVLDLPTPRATRSKPNIMITQPSEEIDDIEMTPQKTDNPEFFTPKESTPAEFFTPMTVKTYTRRKIIKNLENEFLTPKEKAKDLGSQNTAKYSRSKEFQNITKDLELDSLATKLGSLDFDSQEAKKVSSRSRSRVETGSMKAIRDKRSLRRVTSPGKLVDETKPVTRTLRQTKDKK